MYLTGNGGSGLVSSRLPNGSWSPPSAFSVRTGSVGLAYGVDVYACVCVLNTQLMALQQLPRFLQVSPTSLQRETWRSGPFDGSVALRTLRENMSEPWAFGNSGSLVQHLLYWLSLYPTSEPFESAHVYRSRSIPAKKVSFARSFNDNVRHHTVSVLFTVCGINTLLLHFPQVEQHTVHPGALAGLGSVIQIAGVFTSKGRTYLDILVADGFLTA